MRVTHQDPRRRLLDGDERTPKDVCGEASHPPGITKDFIKGEAVSLLRTNSSEVNFEENMRNLSEVIFADRKKAVEQRNKNARKNILPFVTHLDLLQVDLLGERSEPYEIRRRTFLKV